MHFNEIMVNKIVVHNMYGMTYITETMVLVIIQGKWELIVR